MVAIRSALFLLFALLSIFACNKEELGTAEGTRLNMIISKEYDSVGYSAFRYDNQNRLTAKIDSNNRGNISRCFINYDSNGKLLKVTYSSNNTVDGSFLEGTSSFDYDNKDRIVKKFNSATWNPGGSTSNIYSYDTKGRVVKDSFYDYRTNAIHVYGYTIYTYDEKDNVVERKQYVYSGSLDSNRCQYSYDNRPNPFFSQDQLYFILGSDLCLNKNNQIQVKYNSGGILNYNYDYYSNGLPKQASIQFNINPSISYLNFFYE
jgi:hypothetical protein